MYIVLTQQYSPSQRPLRSAEKESGVSSITRRDFLKTLPAAAAGTHLMFAKVAPKTGPNRILLGTGGKDSKGIYIADWNATTGELGNITLAAEVSTPSCLAIYPEGAERLVDAATKAGATESSLTAYRMPAG